MIEIAAFLIVVGVASVGAWAVDNHIKTRKADRANIERRLGQ